MNKLQKFLTLPYLCILIFLIVVPSFFLIFQSFQYSGEFSFRAWIDLFTTKAYLLSFWKSLIYATSVTLLSIIIGYPIALIIWSFKKKYQHIILAIIMLQMWMNLVARIRSIKFMLKIIHLDNSFAGTVIAGTYIFIPFLILALVTQLNKIPTNIIDASKDLGATPLGRFRNIIFPLSLPGLISGIALVFFPAATTVVIPMLINNKWTVGNLIESLVLGNNPSLAYLLSFIIMIVLLGFIALIHKVENKYSMGDDHV